MKCSAVLLLIYAFCVFGSEEVSGENPPSGWKLDGSLTLSEARRILHMSPTDYFYEYRFEDTINGQVGTIVQIPVAAEQNKTLAEITPRKRISIPNFNTPGGKVRNQLTTNGSQTEDHFVMTNKSAIDDKTSSIHGSLEFPPDPIENGVHNNCFDSGDIFKHFKGLKIDSRGELVLTNYTVADLKGHPIITNIDKADFNSSSTSTFDLKEFEIKFGITDNSSRSDDVLSYSADRPPYPSHSIARDAVEKQEIKMAENDLMINNEFYNDIQNALLPGRLELENALKLLEVLQKYGWFVPLHFTTGDCFYDTDTTEVRDSEHAETGSTTPLNSVNSEASSAEYTEKDQNTNRTVIENGSPPMTTRGDAVNETLLKPEEWKIVEYKRLLPTLMLLYRYNNWTLSQCLKLLSEFRVELQPKEAHVDIRKYTLALQQILY